MANQWTKKNPLLSMFLSGANAASGKGRGLWMQQARRNQTTAVKQAVRSWVELWTPASGTKRKRRK
jgi:accessory colonization factor AcfC